MIKMNKVCDKSKCNACFLCVEKCPKKAITVNESLFGYEPIIDFSLCIECGICLKTCPSLNMPDFKKQLSCFQGWSVMKEIRERSASGGVAYEIAKSFIEKGGVVFCCRFKNSELLFERIDDVSILSLTQGSKYVKSSIRDVYKEIVENLKTHKVLFIGLPCQVDAIKRYCRESFCEKLFTVDLVCHGTPSLTFLKKYKKEKNYTGNSVVFRRKTCFGTNIDESKYASRIADSYTLAFLEGLSYTDNCYRCKYARTDRISDITLGDAWTSSIKGEKQKGISLILVQTEKGKTMIDLPNIKTAEIDFDLEIARNHQLSKPSRMPRSRNRFIKLNDSFTIDQAVKKVLPIKTFKQFIKKLLRKKKN